MATEPSVPCCEHVAAISGWFPRYPTYYRPFHGVTFHSIPLVFCRSCRTVSRRVVLSEPVSQFAVPCRTILCRDVSCRTMLYLAMPCRTVSCRTAMCRMMLNLAMPLRTMLYGTFFALYCVVGCRTVPHRVVRCHIVLCRVVQSCTVPYRAVSVPSHALTRPVAPPSQCLSAALCVTGMFDLPPNGQSTRKLRLKKLPTAVTAQRCQLL